MTVGEGGVRAYIGLGGNIGDPKRAMAAALRALDADAATSVGKVSSLYRTPPWGMTDQPDFLNAAAVLVTSRGPRELLELCLRTEQDLKRVRDRRWGPRAIDLDLLVYDALSLNAPGLVVPHPRMLARAFVLVPLAEIAPRLRVAGQTIAAHLARLDRTGIVKAWPGQDWWKMD